MPSYNTVWEWTKEKSLGQSLDESGNPVGEKIASNFAERFARARDQQAEFFADDCIRIADGASDRDSAAAARIQIDVRMKRAAQMKPRVFGERSIVDQNVSINVTMTEEKRLELIERRRLLLEDEDRESPNA